MDAVWFNTLGKFYGKAQFNFQDQKYQRIDNFSQINRVNAQSMEEEKFKRKQTGDETRLEVMSKPRGGKSPKRTGSPFRLNRPTTASDVRKSSEWMK